ncbi:hypothetical protein WOLCODRAFT_151490 [Wolfiporia cocos MD-104 SS10]|uniref:Uncharacterized protein n=1 Tax=Wolfiporia cocos (strain MD-104) TaxID=742152 RepID=A0A2H3JH01_WOLCO|nr:hypothetical protein WOLCODRAFT_151490 [Wolfiporia cocos MD-104 SS10]
MHMRQDPCAPFPHDQVDAAGAQITFAHSQISARPKTEQRVCRDAPPPRLIFSRPRHTAPPGGYLVQLHAVYQACRVHFDHLRQQAAAPASHARTRPLTGPACLPRSRWASAPRPQMSTALLALHARFSPAIAIAAVWLATRGVACVGIAYYYHPLSRTLDLAATYEVAPDAAARSKPAPARSTSRRAGADEHPVFRFTRRDAAQADYLRWLARSNF